MGSTRRTTESRLRFVRGVALVASIVTVVGAVASLPALVGEYQATRVPTGWTTAEGVVVEVDRQTRTSTRYIRPGVVVSGDTYTACAPIVEVEIGGVLLETVPPDLAYDVDHCGIERGEARRVAYDPARPETVRLADGGNAGSGLVLIGGACVGFLLGLYLLRMAVADPVRLLRKGTVVVPDGDHEDPSLARALLLLTIAGAVLAVAFTGFGIDELSEPEWHTEQATLLSDAVPYYGTARCVPTSGVRLASGRTASLGGPSRELCDRSAGDTILVHHREGTWWVSYGAPPERSALVGPGFVLAGVVTGVASAAGAWSLWRSRRRRLAAA